MWPLPCLHDDPGRHPRVVPEGLSIGVDEMRAIVQIAARRPATGNWQIVVIEDADRLTEGAANALLKVVEEPPPSTVFLLCAPSVDPEDVAITLRSRCRHVALVTPSTEAIARVLVDSDGLTPETADWAASVSGGHVGGTAGAMRGAAGAIKDLERRQKSRQTRASRDALDRALIDLATYFRDALMASSGAGAVRANHPDMAERVAAAHAPPERLLRCIEAVLECREALAVNVKPKFAVDAMVATIGQQLG